MSGAPARLENPFEPMPLPAEPAMHETLVAAGAARLWVRDSGGEDEPVVLMHPASGSALVWGYQLSALTGAGYRAIAYSRRGHYGSDPVPADEPGSASLDLLALADHLGLARFHVVASAAGCAVSVDFALSHPGRLASLVLACGTGGITDTHYTVMLESLRPPEFARMPMEFQELSPSYRAANPAGVAAWAALHRKAVSGIRLGQRPVNRITLAALGRLQVPTLLIAGEADLWWPPAALRMVAPHLPACETLLVREAGHSVYWEQPEVFNRAVLDFMARHGRRRRTAD